MLQQQFFPSLHTDVFNETFTEYMPVERKYIEYETVTRTVQVPVTEEVIEYVPIHTQSHQYSPAREIITLSPKIHVSTPKRSPVMLLTQKASPIIQQSIRQKSTLKTDNSERQQLTQSNRQSDKNRLDSKENKQNNANITIHPSKQPFQQQPISIVRPSVVRQPLQQISYTSNRTPQPIYYRPPYTAIPQFHQQPIINQYLTGQTPRFIIPQSMEKQRFQLQQSQPLNDHQRYQVQFKSNYSRQPSPYQSRRPHSLNVKYRGDQDRLRLSQYLPTQQKIRSQSQYMPSGELSKVDSYKQFN